MIEARIKNTNYEYGVLFIFMNLKTDYALRMLRALTDEKQHSVRSLAEDEQVPQAFTYKILKKLSQAGLVKLSRGPGGGCHLVEDLKNVSLYDLITIMEGDAHVTACMQGSYDCEWRRTHGICKIHLNLCVVQEEINQKLRAKSLWEIIGKNS